MVTFTLRNWAGAEAQHCLPEPMACSPGGEEWFLGKPWHNVCHSPRAEQVGWAAAIAVNLGWSGIDASLFYPTALCHCTSFAIIRLSWYSCVTPATVES